MTSVVIVGGGGFSLEVHEYLLDAIEAGSGLKTAGGRLAARPDDILGYLDSGPGLAGRYGADLRNLGDPGSHVPINGAYYVTAIGNSDSRANLWRSLTDKGALFLTLVHPSARVARTATLGQGCVLCPFSIVGPDANVGDDVVVNIYASINHEARVGPHSVLSPYASVMGRGSVGQRGFLGSVAVVAPNASMGDGSKLGANSVLFEQVGPDRLLTGTPAQVRKIYDRSEDAVS